jgi:hypothetical protein
MAESSEYHPRCKYLTSKSLMVFGEDFESDPDYQDGMAEFECLCTSRGEGPDGESVTVEECCNPGRSCYRAY